MQSIISPEAIAKVTLTVTRGVSAGWIAGIPQVLAAQVEGKALGVRERADIGPRFVKYAARRAGAPLSPPMHWLLGGVFHFEYAAGWGALYALISEALEPRRVTPLLGGALLGAAVYTAAFSPIGAATQTGAERDAERRRPHENLIHCTAALTFGLTNAFTYRWLRERW